MLNEIIFRAIDYMTADYNPDGSIKGPGLSGQCAGEWRQEFKANKPLTWGNWKRPEDVPPFNLLQFQEEVFEEAYILKKED